MHTKKILLGCILVGTLLAVGCGKQGPTGPAGPEGPSGITMIEEYTGTFSSDGDFEVNVPEIRGKRTSTFVQAYWALSSEPDLWTPLSDGWKDDPAISRTMTVSWTDGTVSFWGMKANDKYLIQVFEHD